MPKDNKVHKVRPYQEAIVEDQETGFQGYLVVCESDKPLSFGGMRVDTRVTKSLVAELAENMALKLSVHGSPVGGAKAGLRVDPSDSRLPGFLRKFAQACCPLLTTTTMLGKDMGAKQWMLDDIYGALGISQLQLSESDPALRRPCDLSGYIPNMTGKGLFWALEEALGGDVQNKRILIQGFGVVGAGVARHLERAGAKIVGISDREKGMVSPEGFQVESLCEAQSADGIVNHRHVQGSFDVVDRDEVLTQPADGLALAAGSYLVDEALAERIRAAVVAEGANLALTTKAREGLHRRGVFVVPDVVANSSSAALVGHQIASRNTRSPNVLWEQIEQNIRRATTDVHRFSQEQDIDSKTAFRQLAASGGLFT